MSEALVVIGRSFPPATPELLEKIFDAEEKIGKAPQIEVQTEHLIHGGMYVRTVRLAPNVVIVGALIKVPTVLVVEGDTLVFAGGEWVQLGGLQIIPASAGRKAVFATQGPTVIVMSFPTKAKTVEEAEAEFTDETEKLMSRRVGENDLVTITGE